MSHSLTPGGHTLPYRVEFLRQWRRRRTGVVGGLLVGIPLLVLLAFELGGSNTASPGHAPDLSDLATRGGLNFGLFLLAVSSQLLLVVIAALFAGDTVAGEAGWGSLRYLLALPVPRSRLLQQKIAVAVTLGMLGCILLPAISVIIGSLAFGWHPLATTGGVTIDSGPALGRLALVAGYVVISLLPVSALALLLSTHTDAPLGAVGGAVGVFVVCNILDAITSLGSARVLLPTHYFGSWLGVFQSSPDYGPLGKGVLSSVLYAIAFLSLAWWHFNRKDVLS